MKPILALVAFFALAGGRICAAAPRPNVLLILSGDVGWAGFGFNGR
jgi:hypothetical protein